MTCSRNASGFKVLLTVLIVLQILCFGGQATASTLDVLPSVAAPYVLLHLEDIHSMTERLADSFMLKSWLDATPERDVVFEWLRRFPLTSISLVASMGSGVQGAARFDAESERIRDLLEILAKGEDVEEEFMAELLDFPENEILRENVTFSIRRSEEGEGLYEVGIETLGALYDVVGDWEFFASVKMDGDEPLMLIGYSLEDVKKAEVALKSKEKRLCVERRGTGDSFLQFKDDAGGSMTQVLCEEVDILFGFEPRVPASLELSLSLADKKTDFFLRHNLFDVIFGDANRPESFPTLDKTGLKFGGGTPFFAATGNLLITEERALDMLLALTGSEDMDKNEARETLASQGIELGKIVGAIRSFGILLGGHATIGAEYAPGGYAFISGEPEKMTQLTPLFKKLIELSPVMEEKQREGWEIFYTPNDEYREELPLPIFAGMREGVLLAGVLEETALEMAPEIELGGAFSDEPNAMFLAQLDIKSLSSLLIELISPRFLSNLEQTDLDPDGVKLFLAAPAFKNLFHALQELKSVTLSASNWGELNMAIETGDVNYKNLYEFDRTVKIAISTKD